MILDEIRIETGKRRTFAIISHPDAGKTTLTEKLLLYSGTIHTAGIVKGKKGRRAALSDWMAMEQERGISITSSAIQVSYKGLVINILDTPGHEDFSEDTYRTLTAADCAVMVIDASKGVEKQTRKLFEVCRLRKIPVITLINKMDMPGRDPLDLMNEVEKVLQIHSYAYQWPIGRDRTFHGVVDRVKKECLYFTKTASGGAQKAHIDRASLSTLHDTVREELDLLESAGNPFSVETFLRAEVTPVFFASALNNFGIEPFLDTFIDLAPAPHPRLAIRDDQAEIWIDPVTTPFSGYIFKLQANMNPQHRDRMAFIRICSGRFEKDLVVTHHRLGKEIRLSRPHGMVAGERTTVDVAYPGDVIGVINPHLFAIGDTLSVTGKFSYPPLPQFPPEIFAKVYPTDVSRRKSFDKGIIQLADEGAIQILRSIEREGDLIFAAVGSLQLEVLQYRLKSEYGVETTLTLLPYEGSAWIVGEITTFQKSSSSLFLKDRNGKMMLLFRDTWDKQYCIKQNPHHLFMDFSNERTENYRLQ